jgi:uncharacterized protein (TIGR02145 family)
MKTKSLIAALLFVASSVFAQTTITDYDGNIYHPTVIGNQIWLKENLNTTHYRNGSPIQLLNGSANNTQWGNTTTGSYDTYSGSYGKLYNYYAVANSNGVCPIGWHVPNNAEWNVLFKFLDANSDTVSTSGIVSTIGGGSLKDSSSGLWTSPNVGANNSTGFTALPGGFKDNFGSFSNQRNVSFFWSTSTIALPIFNYFVYQCYATLLYNNSTSIAKYYWEKNYGLSIRCISDTLACTSAPTGSITPDGPTTFCSGNSVTLSAPYILGVNYQWKKNGVNITSNGNSRSYKATATGSYSCVMTNACGFNISNSISVTTKTNAFASVTASGATSFCAGDSVTLNCTNLGSNYSVQWYRTNISMENATNYSLVVKQPGTYKVVTKNLTTGCSRISGSAITTNVNCRIANNNLSEPTSNDINEESKTLAQELSQGVNLFPNPNNGSFKFTYEGEVEGEGTIQVINAMGQVIYQSQAIAEDGRISKEIFLGDQYQKGIYIVRLLINGGQNDSRMIVQ